MNGRATPSSGCSRAFGKRGHVEEPRLQRLEQFGPSGVKALASAVRAGDRGRERRFAGPEDGADQILQGLHLRIGAEGRGDVAGLVA